MGGQGRGSGGGGQSDWEEGRVGERVGERGVGARSARERGCSSLARGSDVLEAGQGACCRSSARSSRARSEPTVSRDHEASHGADEDELYPEVATCGEREAGTPHRCHHRRRSSRTRCVHLIEGRSRLSERDAPPGCSPPPPPPGSVARRRLSPPPRHAGTAPATPPGGPAPPRRPTAQAPPPPPPPPPLASRQTCFAWPPARHRSALAACRSSRPRASPPPTAGSRAQTAARTPPPPPPPPPQTGLRRATAAAAEPWQRPRRPPAPPPHRRTGRARAHAAAPAPPSLPEAVPASPLAPRPRSRPRASAGETPSPSASSASGRAARSRRRPTRRLQPHRCRAVRGRAPTPRVRQAWGGGWCEIPEERGEGGVTARRLEAAQVLREGREARAA